MRAIDHIKEINIFRISMNGNSFTECQFKQVLKDAKLPSNKLFISTFIRSPVLTKVNNQELKFTFDKPVFYKVLDRIYKDYRIIANKYQSTYRSKCLTKNI